MNTIVWSPTKPYFNLPSLPPQTDVETKAVLKQCIISRTALAELNAAWQAASQDIYAAQQQQGGAQQGAPHADAGAGTNGQQQGGSNQPEDVEFEEVK